MTRKSTPYIAPSSAPGQRRSDNPRQLTSALIGVHLAAFEAAGGKVEVLSTTTVLKRIHATETPDKPGG